MPQHDVQGDPRPRGGVVLATILLACFIAEHNLPFSTADHLVELMKIMFPDSAIAQGMTMGRTKCTDVIKILGRCVMNELIEKMRLNKFSIIIDESTDISTLKSMAVIVRFFDRAANTVKTSMLQLIDMYNTNEDMQGSTGQNLYTQLMHTLGTHQIPLENFIGFAADGASNIMGELNSLSSRLRSNLPGITIIKCVCHSLHLCASEAARTLPKHCEDLIRNVYTYFSHSAKRKVEFKQFQDFCEVKPHKILHPCQTRWLSLHEAVRRVIEQWQALKMYFDSKESEERLRSIELIVKDLRDPSVYLYFHFLDFILPAVNNINLLFQKETPTIHLLHSTIRRLYRNLIGYFCRSECIQATELSELNPSDERIFLPTSQIYLGAKIHALLQTEEYRDKHAMLEYVRTRCRTFMVTLCIQLKKRFNMQGELFRLCSFLSPRNVLDIKSRTALPSLTSLVQAVPRIYDSDVQILDNEWRNLDSVTLPQDLVPDCNILEFYEKLGKVTDDDGRHHFKNLCSFIMQVLSLPTSNADAERLFSKLSLMKTKTRNRLQLPSTNALILVSEAVRDKGACVNFKPSQLMLNSIH